MIEFPLLIFTVIPHHTFTEWRKGKVGFCRWIEGKGGKTSQSSKPVFNLWFQVHCGKSHPLKTINCYEDPPKGPPSQTSLHGGKGLLGTSGSWRKPVCGCSNLMTTHWMTPWSTLIRMLVRMLDLSFKVTVLMSSSDELLDERRTREWALDLVTQRQFPQNVLAPCTYTQILQMLYWISHDSWTLEEPHGPVS